MFISLLFLKLDDIDDAYEELKNEIPDLKDAVNNKKCEQFITYLEHTWIGTDSTKAMFDRSIWNLYDNISFRTNNISETYNKRMNGLITKSNPNVYAMIDIVKEEEIKTSVSFEKANLEKVKTRKAANEIKDLKITNLKLRYDKGDLEIMNYLIEIKNFVKVFD